MLPALDYISPDDYLEQERAAVNKHEYFKGEIVAMAGASLEYILINSTSYYIQTGRKQEDGSWKFEDVKDINATLRIETVQHQIPLSEIYANVRF